MVFLNFRVKDDLEDYGEYTSEISSIKMNENNVREALSLDPFCS